MTPETPVKTKPPQTSTLGVVVTRPKRQAAPWVKRLIEQGVPAVALPLIEIAPPPSVHPLVAAWRRRDSFSLMMFVSPNAVTAWFQTLALKPAEVGAQWPAGLRAGSIGPGTTVALKAAGVPTGQIVQPEATGSQFDSEALWAQLQPESWAGREVLVVRGAGGRDWLAQQLTEAGGKIEFVQAYDRRCPALGTGARNLLASCLAKPAAAAWLFSSSEAITNLQSLAPTATWDRALAIATHERIAAQAKEAGFGEVLTVGAGIAQIVGALPAAFRQTPPVPAPL